MVRPSGKGQRVLAVDDDAPSRGRLGQALADAGFEPLLAATGEEGLRLLRNRLGDVDWLYTKADLPGLVDGWILGDEFHQVRRGRPVLYGVAPHATRPARVGEVLLALPVDARGVAAIFVSLTGSAASGPARRAAWSTRSSRRGCSAWP